MNPVLEKNETSTASSEEFNITSEGLAYKNSTAALNPRMKMLREQSVETPESISIERAVITTRFFFFF